MSGYNQYQSGYPGLGSDLRSFPDASSEEPLFPMGTHSSVPGATSELLQVREVAMMAIMDALTDKPRWHEKVFDDTVVAKWRQEALALPDNRLWGKIAGGKLRVGEASQVGDGFIDANGPGDYSSRIRVYLVQGIVTDEMFDYVILELRNKAKYFKWSGLTPTLDATATIVKSDSLVSGELNGKLRQAFATLMQAQEGSPDWHPGSNDMVWDLVHPSLYPLVYGRSRVCREEVVNTSDTVATWAGKGDTIAVQQKADGGEKPPEVDRVPDDYWSERYQWLPANIAFIGSDSVEFTSYINNLHPTKHPEIYTAVEELIAAALPAWDQCLHVFQDGKRWGSGRTGARFPRPQDPDARNPANWIPPNSDCITDRENKGPATIEREWRSIRQPVLPNPPAYIESDYTPSTSLRSMFAYRGLQVIVKMASIELTPQKPVFPAGGWHVEGQMNEQICATALYYVDSDNITSSSLAFRMLTEKYQTERYMVGQDAYSWLEHVFGTQLSDNPGSACLQYYGNVKTPEGRLLAFPNVFHHRVESFRLADPTKPGHRRFVALWLVDPHRRIISTANVPPQRLDWWEEEAGVVDTQGADALSAELRAAWRANREGGALMSTSEAHQHRENLMKDRSGFTSRANEAWTDLTYNFCEH